MIYVIVYILTSYLLTYLMLKYVYQQPKYEDQKKVAYWSFLLSPFGFIFLSVVFIVQIFEKIYE